MDYAGKSTEPKFALTGTLKAETEPTRAVTEQTLNFIVVFYYSLMHVIVLFGDDMWTLSEVGSVAIKGKGGTEE